MLVPISQPIVSSEAFFRPEEKAVFIHWAGGLAQTLVISAKQAS